MQLLQILHFDLNSNNWFARVETQGPYDYGDTILTQAAGQNTCYLKQ